jgi:hypothetical protein
MEIQYTDYPYKIAMFEMKELKDVTYEEIKNTIYKCKAELESYDKREERRKERERTGGWDF